VTLAEILVSTGRRHLQPPKPGELQPVDTATLAAAKSKAGELEASSTPAATFAELARTFSDGPTAAEGGDLGQFHPAPGEGAGRQYLRAQAGSIPSRSAPGRASSSSRWRKTPGGVPSFKDVSRRSRMPSICR